MPSVYLKNGSSLSLVSYLKIPNVDTEVSPNHFKDVNIVHYYKKYPITKYADPVPQFNARYLLFDFRVNNCVAFNNYKFFILFLGYALCYCVFLAACTLQYFLMFWTDQLEQRGAGKFHILFLFFVSIMFCIRYVGRLTNVPGKS